MDSDIPPQSAAATLRIVRVFLRDFMAFSGTRFGTALAYVMAGALFESIGLLLLVPLLALVTGVDASRGIMQQGAQALFGLTGASAAFGRLAVLLAIFVLLMILRGVVILRRDLIVQSLQI